MSELNLLIECINTEGEAEAGGVKYIYMDADTIYRFENNRMKKITKTLINKARKQIQNINNVNQLRDESQDVINKKQKRLAKQKTRVKQQVINNDNDDNDDDDDNDADDVNDINDINDDNDTDDNDNATEKVIKQKQKPVKSKRVKQTSHVSTRNEFDYNPNINLDEYYNNKNKMEYMNLEITRLNNKVDKLKHYKAIVNKLTGNEFDFDIPSNNDYANANANANQQQQQYQQRHGLNDSLFLY